METLSVTFAGDPQTYHVITDCKESDACPGCGAGYKAGLIECEYCRRPVRLATGNLGPKDMLAIMHTGEAILPRAYKGDRPEH